MRKVVLLLAIAVALTGATASGALGYVSSYPPPFGTVVLAPGADANSNWDNCVYYVYEIAINDFFKSAAKLGRAAVILTNGTWVGSAQSAAILTTAFVNSHFNDTKKGYMKNTSSSTYTGEGYISGNTGCV